MVVATRPNNFSFYSKCYSLTCMHLYAVWLRFLVLWERPRSKETWSKERVCFILWFQVKSITEGSQDRNLCMAGTWKQELLNRLQRNSSYFLAPHNFFSQLPYCIQDHQTRGGTVHSSLGLSIPVIKLKDAPQTCPETNLVGTVPYWVFLKK